jgi:flagellar motor switch/type III secretory pathway protein FliN
VSDELTSIDGLNNWQPHHHLRAIGADVVNFSCGFLRSRPQKWFPTVSSQWLTLCHSLGVEFRMVEVVPGLAAPDNLETTFTGIFQGEKVGISFDRDTETLLGEIILASAPLARGILLEYLARRLFTSLSLAWTGPSENGPTKFLGISNEPTYHFIQSQLGGVKLVFSFGGRTGTLWISLSATLLKNIDGLWKRQLRSSVKPNREGTTFEVEIAQLGVPTEELETFLVPGAVIELEAPVSDLVIIRNSGRPWAVGRLCVVGDYFGLEFTNKPVPEDSVYDGVQLVSIRLPAIEVPGPTIAEINQTGAIITTSIEATPEVELISQGRFLGQAILQEYQGSFAITIVGE